VSNAWNTVAQDVGTDPLVFYNTRRAGSPGVLTGTRPPPLIGDRFVDPNLKVAILANAVVGSLLGAALQRDDGVRRAIARDLTEQRSALPGRPGLGATLVQTVTNAAPHGLDAPISVEG
jgi:hypothetical protein